MPSEKPKSKIWSKKKKHPSENLPVDLIYSVKPAIRPRAARAEVSLCVEIPSALLPVWEALGASVDVWEPDVREPVAGTVFVDGVTPWAAAWR